MTAAMGVGERVAAYRRQRGLSQRNLAAEVRRSESWISQVERGIQPVERLSVLRALAEALGVTVHDLRPEDVPPPSPDEVAPVINDLDAIRLSLSGHPALQQLFAMASTDAVAEFKDLERAVDQAWDLAHASQFAELSTTLTELLPRLEEATRSSKRRPVQRRLHSLRVRTYQAAAAAFARQDEPDAAWVAADRAITAAEQAGNSLEVIAGHYRLAHAFLRLRRFEQAEHVTVQAIDTLRSLADAPDATPEVLSLYGALHLTQAVIAGHEGDRSRARTHLDHAETAALHNREDRNDFHTEFGPTNVQLHRIAVAADLGDAGEALDIAQHVDTSRLSPERQARFHLDLARAHTQRRHINEATAALIDAERLAPEHIRSHHHTRSTLSDLLTQAGPQATRQLLDLAARAGATP